MLQKLTKLWHLTNLKYYQTQFHFPVKLRELIKSFFLIQGGSGNHETQTFIKKGSIKFYRNLISPYVIRR